MSDLRKFKILVVGDRRVGKTSFIQRYVNDRFIFAYNATIGASFARKIVTLPSSETVSLHFWDIQGQEQPVSLTRAYYFDAAGCIVVFDVCNERSMNNVIHWKNDIDEKIAFSDGKPIPCVLVGNKSDLEDHHIPKQLIKRLAIENHFIDSVKASAKTGERVEEAVMLLAEEMVKRHDQLYAMGNGWKTVDETAIRLSAKECDQKKSCCHKQA